MQKILKTVEVKQMIREKEILEADREIEQEGKKAKDEDLDSDEEEKQTKKFKAPHV